MRWVKFSAVGCVGVAVQLSVLWFCAHILSIPSVVAVVIGVEIALLHNFTWHEAWTWRGMPAAGRWRRLWRFHMSSGFVSLGSNALFTWLFNRYLGIPLLVSNLGAIGVTSLLNFALADLWVFRSEEAS